MIARIWHGWTVPQNAEKYEALLREEIFVGIQNRRIPGFKSIQLLRRPIEDEVEFITIMVFDSLDGVREFAGEDYERAVDQKRRGSCCLGSINAPNITRSKSNEKTVDKCLADFCLYNENYGINTGDVAELMLKHLTDEEYCTRSFFSPISLFHKKRSSCAELKQT